MGNRIKARVNTYMAKNFSTSSKGRGSRKGEQGKGRHPGYSGGKRRKAILSGVPKRAYAKRLKA